MASPSEKTTLEKTARLESLVKQSLQKQESELSPEVLRDIQSARMNALNSGGKLSLWHKLKQSTSEWQFQYAAPVALAVVMVVLVNFQQEQAIPELPADIFVADVPTEDLQMLEDLEFVDWLAKQEEAVL